MKARAKKGGEIAKNGEYYSGGCFLPSTQLAKQSCTQNFNSAYRPKPLNEWQLKNLLNAIDGTEKSLAFYKAQGDIKTIQAYEAQLNNYLKKLAINNSLTLNT